MTRSRRLSDAEIEVWLKVARTVSPRPGASTPALPAPFESPLPALPAAPKPPKFAAPKPRPPTAASYSPPVSSPGALHPIGLERRYKKRIAIGRIDIDDALDLHGMTQAQAHGALSRFLVRAQAEGARLVLVVTGKGGISRARPDGFDHAEIGVLRRSVPHWLRDAGLRRIVVGFEEAARPHGGAGALYIRLRRRGD